MTRASSSRPTRREVEARDGDLYVAEVSLLTLRLRPKGTRRGGPAEIEVGWGSVYLRAMQAIVEDRRKVRKRSRRAR